MAITKPLKWDTTSAALKQMTDAELELVAYQLRKAWASDLLGTYNGNARDSSATTTNGYGALYVGPSASPAISGVSNLITLYDKRKNAVHTTKADSGYSEGTFDNAADNDDTFTAPSEATFDASETIISTYHYEEYVPHGVVAIPDAPTPTTLRDHSYLYWDASGYAKVEGTTANIIDTIIKLANYEMMNGDYVGLLEIASGSPGSDYTELGLFHTNTVMTWSSYQTDGGGSSVSASSNLYLRTQNSSYDEAAAKSASDNIFLRWDNSTGGVKQSSPASAFSMIANVLMPIWKRSSNFNGVSGDYGFPRYKFSASAAGSNTYERQIAYILDTVYTDSTSTDALVGGAGGTYYKTRYGSGSLTTNSAHYVIAYLPDANAVRT